ncbi:hypothetical protein V1477_006188 [Vespula maculifrons]|uniref:Uncharacterized protein n=1 Tax=Vespula maculifrons TaxID=7453 RepID=A0ABD2CJQ5_VESMC
MDINNDSKKFYFDNDDSRDKFNSKQNDVDVWPIIDIANLNLISKIPNTTYRKNEVKWMIETNNNNIKIIESNIENRNDYESGKFNYGLKNEFRRNQIQIKESLTFKMINPTGTIKRCSVCQDNVIPEIFSNPTRNELKRINLLRIANSLVNN